MPDVNRPDWKTEIAKRIGDVDDAILEELAQHLESRYEEVGSFDAVMSEWSADDLRAELARIKRRREIPVPGHPTASLWEGIWNDVRYSLRQFRLNPGFVVVAILSLALGIGANTAIFQLLDAVRLRTLTVKNPRELYNIKLAGDPSRCCRFNTRYPQSTYAIWENVRKEQQGFSTVFAWATATWDLATGGQTRYARGALWVSGEFYAGLGVRPALGRLLTADDDKRGCSAPGAVLSHAFWQREYGGDRSVVGRKIMIESHPFDVIGVSEAGFFGPEMGRSYDLALPMCADPIINGEQTRLDARERWWLVIMGRLKPGWTEERVNAQLAAVSPGIFANSLYAKWDSENAKRFLEFKLAAFPAAEGLSQLRRQYQDPLVLLLAISALVLLIACANLANLLLARASVRRREIAIRLALGASRARLIRQLLVESLLLAGGGALSGALVAVSLSGFLVSFISNEAMPIYVDLGANWRMFAFLAALAVLTCLLFGLAPALRATRTAPAEAMKAGGRSSGVDRERSRLRQVLVVSQVSLSLVLLVSSLLFMRSLTNLLRIDAGFQPAGILQHEYDFSRLPVPASSRTTFRRNVLERMRAIPGVESAASMTIVPLSGSGWNNNIWMEGQDRSQKQPVLFNRVSDNYFKTLGTAMLTGRDFDQRDSLTAPPVAIVTEAFARRLTGGASPLGRRFRIDGQVGEKVEDYLIVGFVKDSKYFDLRDDLAPVVYLATSQDLTPDPGDSILMRSSMASAALMSAVKQTMEQVNSQVSYDLYDYKTMTQRSMQRDRLMAALSGVFGLLAVVLAMVGLYGVMSYSVARRTHEIGIRMALGADQLRISKMILHEASLLLGLGIVTGAAVSLYVVKFADKLVFGLHPNDPLTFALAAGSLAAVAMAASYWPAHRAARLDPTVALREE